jgi:dTDP-4-amino-4,6-dideoxygalactose transaminase
MHYFPILVGDDYPLSHDQRYDTLMAQGIHGRRYFYPLITEFPMYPGLPSSHSTDLPVAAETAKRVICLPIDPARSDHDISRMLQILSSATVATPC